MKINKMKTRKYQFQNLLRHAFLVAMLAAWAFPVGAQRLPEGKSLNLRQGNFMDYMKSRPVVLPISKEGFTGQKELVSTTLPTNKHNAPTRATSYTGGVYDMVDVYEYENQSRTTTICDGTSTNSLVPFGCRYFSTAQTSSVMIYPASLLSDLQPGDKISKLTFYAASNVGYSIGQANVLFLISETANTTTADLDGLIDNLNNMTVCFNGSLTTGSNTVTITLNEPYVWYGGNLIIGSYVNSAATNSTYYNGVNWYGRTGFSTGASISNYYTQENQGTWLNPNYVYVPNTNRYQFLPKMQITYTTQVATGAQTKAHVTYDKPFFETISYAWTDSAGTTHESHLSDPATDPDQIIAMMREVYTNPDIPGNFKRGFNAQGKAEPYNDVYYAGVGTPALNSNNEFVFSDYGWGIGGNLNTWRYAHSTNSGTVYSYVSAVDTTQYKPDYDGLTLLLVELVDDYSYSKVIEEANATTFSSNADVLRFFIKKTIKSARIISEAKRTGTGLDRGTLFRIDCDKMNKFFFLAKGQLRWVLNSFEVETEDTYTGSDGKEHNYILGATWSAPPCLIYSDYYNTHAIADNYGYRLFYHMFEQFSPVTTNATSGLNDIYKGLVDLDTYGVEHDCASIANLNHQFMMYGQESGASDCQDVRDLLFFVPDYRMMKWTPPTITDTLYGRDPAMFEKYLNYNKNHQPLMGLHAIHQYEITGSQVGETDYYQLNLSWKSNLDTFLPGDEQEYELYQVVIDEDGNETYVPVYYRDAAGNYVDAEGNPSDTPVPVVLHLGAGAEKNYPYVYEPMGENSHVVTYAVRGCDTGHFLSLQMSNQQSFVVPGLDKNEKIVLSDATYYSRYNPDTEKNCYSNKLVITNDALGLRVADLKGGSAGANATRLDVYRMHNERVDGENQTVKELVVSLKVQNTSDRKMNVTWGEDQAQAAEFPMGLSDINNENRRYAGYHQNTITDTYTYNTRGDYVVFNNLVIWDNFTVDVSKNEHPGQYFYKIETNYNDNTMTEGATAYSNTYRIPVFKTGSQINGSFSREEVDGDTNHAVGVDKDVEFGAQVRYSSKTEILRYDAYRWDENDPIYIQNGRFIVDQVGENDVEQDLPPTGIAGNQDGSYTVSMNDVDDPDNYTTSTVTVNPGETDKWATFVDKIAASTPGAYVYAPVVETFSVGKGVDGKTRGDYNTYGGPLQFTATGDVEVKECTKYQNQDYPQKSEYTWIGDGTTGIDGKQYAYYSMLLNMNALGDETTLIPDGYELYKVRVWRVIDEEYLGEQLADRRDSRMKGEVLVAEVTFPDIDRAYSSELALGSAAPGFDDVKTGEMMATFGALDVTAQGQEQNIPVKFIVRAYFTRYANIADLDVPAGGQGAPRRAASKGAVADGKYYIVEKELESQLTGIGNDKIVTAVADLTVNRTVDRVIYYNSVGMSSNKPFSGINVVVTRYTDGTTSTIKVVR